MEGQHLECPEQVRTERDTQRMPATEDHHGKCDPPEVESQGLPPSQLDVQRVRGTRDSDHRAAEDRIPKPELVDVDPPGEGRSRTFTNALQVQARTGSVEQPPRCGDREEAEVHDKVLVEEHLAEERDIREERDRHGWDPRATLANERVAEE